MSVALVSLSLSRLLFGTSFTSSLSLVVSIGFLVSAVPSTPAFAFQGTPPISDEASKPHRTEDLIRNTLKRALKNDSIAIHITPLLGDQYAVALTGEIESEAKKTDIKTALQKAVENIIAADAKNKNLIQIDDDTYAGVKVTPSKDPQVKDVNEISKAIAAFLPDGVSARIAPFIKTTSSKTIRDYRIFLSGTVATTDKKAELNKTVAAVIPHLHDGARTICSTVNDDGVMIDPSDEIKRQFEQRLGDKRLKILVRREEGAPSKYVVAISGIVENTIERKNIRVIADQVLNSFLCSPAVNPSEKQPFPQDGSILRTQIRVDRTYLAATDPEITDYWPISYLGGAGTADATVTLVIDSLADALNATYGSKDAKVVVRDGNNLHLRGKYSTVLKVKSALALLDSAQPQVQMDFWAVQISGDADQVANRTKKIRSMIANSRAGMALFGELLRETLSASADDTTINLNEELRQGGALAEVYSRLFPMKYQRFIERQRLKKGDKQQDDGRKDKDDPFTGSFTNNEALILFSICNKRAELVKRFEDKWLLSPGWILAGSDEQIKKKAKLHSLLQENVNSLKEATESHNRHNIDILKKRQKVLLEEARTCDKEVMKRSSPFTRLTFAAEETELAGEQRSVLDFLDAVNNYGALVGALGLEGEPRGATTTPVNPTDKLDLDPADVIVLNARAAEGLGQRSVAVDGLLRALMDAVQADLQTLYLDPLVDRIRAVDRPRPTGFPRARDTDGVALIGRTHMVVTTRQKATLKPELTSTVNATVPAPFGADLLNIIAPAGAGGNKTSRTTTTADGTTSTTNTATDSTDTTGLSGVAKLLSGLPSGQAALLAGALLNDVAPVYRTVAPGVAIAIKPSMTPDGGAADLYMDSTFGVRTSSLGSDTARTDVWAQAEPAAVQSHNVTTQAYVSGFDLFDISSFSVETATPQAPVQIPILSRVPILGPMFQFPRGSKRVQHESIILVNAWLLPRALGLAGFYGAGRRSRDTNPLPSSGATNPPPTTGPPGAASLKSKRSL